MPYHILCMLGTWNVNFFNGLFLFYAHKDSSRRIHLMRFISCSLKIKSTGKNSHQIKLPTLNFLDTESLETWLEARKIVSQLGKRFQIRLQYYTSFFIMLCITSQVFLFGILGNLIEGSVFSYAAWISFLVHII